MLAHRISIWRLYSFSEIPLDLDGRVFLHSQNPNMSAKLVRDPEPYFFHMDRRMTIAELVLSGIFNPEKIGKIEDQLLTGVKNRKAQRAQDDKTGISVVFEAKAETTLPEVSKMKDAGDFDLYYGDIDKNDMSEQFEIFIKVGLNALALNIQNLQDELIERIGDTLFFEDSARGKPIYSLKFVGGRARITTSIVLSEDIASKAKEWGKQLMEDEKLNRPIGLLLNSLDVATANLPGFMSAWSALEIFVNTKFAQSYRAIWSEILRNGAPQSFGKVIERVEDVMKDKYTLGNKFLVIASVLDEGAAGEDYEEFKRLKGIRDDLAHGINIPEYFPTDAPQKLLSKYMRLHLEYLQRSSIQTEN